MVGGTHKGHLSTKQQRHFCSDEVCVGKGTGAAPSREPGGNRCRAVVPWRSCRGCNCRPRSFMKSSVFMFLLDSASPMLRGYSLQVGLHPMFWWLDGGPWAWRHCDAPPLRFSSAGCIAVPAWLFMSGMRSLHPPVRPAMNLLESWVIVA